MKRSMIEAKIRLTEKLIAEERNTSMLASLNRCMEKLIMMDADDDAELESVPEPRRIQLSRKKGYRKPPEAVVVSRPSRWGNQFSRGMNHPEHGWPMSAQEAVDCFRKSLLSPSEAILPSKLAINDIQDALRGKTLACWCPLDQPCHSDVLIEIANGSRTG